MDPTQFQDLQEALMFIFQPVAFWWLVLLLAAILIMALAIAGLGLARWFMSYRAGFPQRFNPLP